MVARRTLTLASLLGLLLVGLALPASANYVYDKGYTYYTSTEQCVGTRSEISHGPGGGYSKTDNNSRAGLMDPHLRDRALRSMVLCGSRLHGEPLRSA